MKLRELEARLQSLRGFEKPKIAWEQYATTPHLAGRWVGRGGEERGRCELDRGESRKDRCRIDVGSRKDRGRTEGGGEGAGGSCVLNDGLSPSPASLLTLFPASLLIRCASLLTRVARQHGCSSRPSRRTATWTARPCATSGAAAACSWPQAS